MEKTYSSSNFAKFEFMKLLNLELRTFFQANRIVFVITLHFFFFGLKSQNPGDIIFTGFNSEGPDQFSFMSTIFIAGNTQIHFTDNGWSTNNGGEFRINEGELLYTTPSQGLQQGDQIVIQCSGSSPSIIYGEGSIVQLGANSIVFTASGDGIIAFTGSLNNPTHIAALTTDASGWVNPTANTQTNIPNGLVVGESAFLILENNITESDNWIYNCDTIFGTQAEIQFAIGQIENWSSDNDNNFTLPCTPFSASWDGTWNPSKPSAQNDLIITSTSPIVSDLTCRNLTISPGEALDMGTNTLHIYGNIENNGNGIQSTGTIQFYEGLSELVISGNPFFLENIIELEEGCILNADSNLIIAASSSSTFGQVSGNGELKNLIIQKYIDPTIPKYFYLGLPLNNSMLSEFNEGNILYSASGSQGSIWQWDASIAEWQEPGNVDQTVAIAGKAYAVYAGVNSYGTFLIANPGPLNFIGSPIMDSVDLALEYNDGQNSTSVTFVGGSSLVQTQGWNLIANPYPCYYDWERQSIPQSLGSAIYRFDGTNYTSYIQGAGSGSRYLEPGEGFFVQLNSNTNTSLIFAPGLRDPKKLGGSNKSSTGFNGIKIRAISKTTKRQDEVYIGFDHSASLNFDAHLDAWKLMNLGESPNLFCQMNDGKLSVNRFSMLSKSAVIPLSFHQALDGDSIQLKVDLQNLDLKLKIFIEDLKTKRFLEFTESGYRFLHDLNFSQDRFRLHFEKINLTNDNGNENLDQWFISQDEYGLNIHHNRPRDQRVNIYDLQGQRISSKKIQTKETLINIAKKGVYLIQICDEQNHCSSQKTIFF